MKKQHFSEYKNIINFEKMKFLSFWTKCLQQY